MNESGNLPGGFLQLQNSLRPYIKPRLEVTRIRRVLCLYLSSHLKDIDSKLIARPLAMPHSSYNLDSKPQGVRGLQKEYLQCFRSNIKARKEYHQLSKEHQVSDDKETLHVEPFDLTDEGESAFSIDLFIDLVRNWQKHERLHIIQDYVDLLYQKSASSDENLKPKNALKGIGALPKVPHDVMPNLAAHNHPLRANLEDLLVELEKSVLRAKYILKHEQALLSKVKTDQETSLNRGTHLHALEATRNELINWIERELARAGESAANASEASPRNSGNMGEHSFQASLESTQRLYLQYVQARQRLVDSSTGKIDPSLYKVLDAEPEIIEAKESQLSTSMNLIHPYLKGLVSVSSEKKSFIQQKSHVTTSLARQVKDEIQDFDRLAEESHLLPAHPVPAATVSKRNENQATISLDEDISTHEKLDTSSRAQAWVFASQSAGHLTADSVLEKVEQGEISIRNSRNTLTELHNLLGIDSPASMDVSHDIWAVLDGNLGAIQGDRIDIS